MERFERFVKNMSKTFEWVGVVGYLIMVLVNVIDVVGSKFFNFPLPGAFEVTSFAQVIAIALTIPIGLYLGFHISIDFILEKFPDTPKRLINIFVSIILVIFFGLILYQTLEYGYSLQISDEIGSVSKIPLFPFAYVIAIGIVPVILFYIIKTMTSIKGR
ncbi:MAG: TRAP transporter small permease [Syntrophorhabdaceae bacterium]|nr:TRAP transporter small permease [Syntrophorhabdaceae bacterium]